MWYQRHLRPPPTRPNSRADICVQVSYLLNSPLGDSRLLITPTPNLKPIPTQVSTFLAYCTEEAGFIRYRVMAVQVPLCTTHFHDCSRF